MDACKTSTILTNYFKIRFWILQIFFGIYGRFGDFPTISQKQILHFDCTVQDFAKNLHSQRMWQIKSSSEC